MNPPNSSFWVLPGYPVALISLSHIARLRPEPLAMLLRQGILWARAASDDQMTDISINLRPWFWSRRDRGEMTHSEEEADKVRGRDVNGRGRK
jgi:hypothetical protein